MGSLARGIKGRQESRVIDRLTAKSMGSGELEVLATPALIALCEETAWKSIAEFLADGQGTVGTRMDFSHESATPVGMKFWCESELVEIDRRKLLFSVKAYDEAGVIGHGMHERFIVDNEKFMGKAAQKVRAFCGQDISHPG